MQIVTGEIVDGVKHWTGRIERAGEVFNRVTGEELCPGTLNVKIHRRIPINEHFRVTGFEIGEPKEDFILEICRINGLWAYRVRPLNLHEGGGGLGDDVLEILCKVHLRETLGVKTGDKVKVELFRQTLNFGYR